MGGMERFGLREGGDAKSDGRRLLLGPAELLAKELLFPRAWISDAPKLIGRFRSGPRSGTAFSFDGVAVRFEEKVVSAMFFVITQGSYFARHAESPGDPRAGRRTQ